MKVSIADSTTAWLHQDVREGEFFNFIDGDDKGLDSRSYYPIVEGEDRHLIKIRIMMISNEGETHDREASNLIQSIEDLGGL